jgi:RNA polymerase sigma-70 factor, ECF subfamily
MNDGGRVDRERLLRRAVLSGDEKAWRALYESACDRLYAYVLWRCGSLRDRADEVAQECWLHAVRRIADFDPERAPFIAWLRGIAAKVLQNRHRRDRRHQASPLDGDLAAPDASRVEAELVAEALASLPPRYEAVLRAKYLDGSSMADIAAESGETPKAVESLLSRARQAFRDAYRELG